MIRLLPWCYLTTWENKFDGFFYIDVVNSFAFRIDQPMIFVYLFTKSEKNEALGLILSEVLFSQKVYISENRLLFVTPCL